MQQLQAGYSSHNGLENASQQPGSSLLWGAAQSIGKQQKPQSSRPAFQQDQAARHTLTASVSLLKKEEVRVKAEPVEENEFALMAQELESELMAYQSKTEPNSQHILKPE